MLTMPLQYDLKIVFPSSLMQINYARNVYEELTQAVIEDTDMDGDHTEL